MKFPRSFFSSQGALLDPSTVRMARRLEGERSTKGEVLRPKNQIQARTFQPSALWQFPSLMLGDPAKVPIPLEVTPLTGSQFPVPD